MMRLIGGVLKMTKYTKRVTILCTDRMYVMMKSRAHQVEMNVSEYFRDLFYRDAGVSTIDFYEMEKESL